MALSNVDFHIYIYIYIYIYIDSLTVAVLIQRPQDARRELWGGNFEPLGGCFWGLLGAFFGPLEGLGLVGGLRGVLGASWRLLFPLLGPSWACPGVLLGCLGRLWGRLEALLGRPGAVLGAS